MSSLDKALGDSLALVNIARQAFGHEALNDLPRARPGDSAECLYARALQDLGAQGVSGGGQITFASTRVAEFVASLWGSTAIGRQVQAPSQLAAVIHPFDNDGLPQYRSR